ncbi:translation initiation factor IF-5A [Fervidicoccus fontis]|uniref:Translation initiation factor 5A n=2 Tax=Fervidicoccus fontis TaxID=683846 RepID=I0A297_FERFK|nr:translation initiation factor IF-5A [Fervidicoccus fontis]AFH43104.1 translation initiation factor IF-5A [Fervidicoccus fontis Kam940]MBE9390484.1 translation initiation factor IF-5A [Fervidicoccus fontis]PMB77950.1 MAG: translation initiation factor IF-5A [Fervidicoccus fontis]HEW63955.1 translation initiation factor IF-5A [Fervidicoccus fontis]
MSINYISLGDVKIGTYIIIENEPCRVVEITKAKTGKHGSAKAHVVAIGLFTGNKRTLTAPVDQRVEQPIIEKKVAQVIADLGNSYQLMDMESYETFEVQKPNDPELLSKIAPGKEVEYWEVMGQRIIVRMRG